MLILEEILWLLVDFVFRLLLLLLVCILVVLLLLSFLYLLLLLLLVVCWMDLLQMWDYVNIYSLLL